MGVKWKQGEWEIHHNTIVDKPDGGWCLRHVGCNSGRSRGDGSGQCSCTNDECYVCKLKVPDEIKGFFALVKWTR